MAHEVMRLLEQFLLGVPGQLAEQVVDVRDVTLQVGGGNHHDVFQCAQYFGVDGLHCGTPGLIRKVFAANSNLAHPRFTRFYF